MAIFTTYHERDLLEVGALMTSIVQTGKEGTERESEPPKQDTVCRSGEGAFQTLWNLLPQSTAEGKAWFFSSDMTQADTLILLATRKSYSEPFAGQN